MTTKQVALFGTTVFALTFIGLVGIVNSLEKHRELELKEDAAYVGSFPIVTRPTLNAKIRQWEIMFSISNHAEDKNSWRIAFFPMNQNLTDAAGLGEEQINRLGAGDEVEVLEATEVIAVGPPINHVYFAVSAKKHYN